MESTFIAGMVGSLVFSIFFSGIEVAFLSANRLHVEPEREKSDIAGRAMRFFARKPTWFIGTTLIGNIASLILFGVFTTVALLSWYERQFAPLSLSTLIPIVVLTFVLSIVILYTVEFFSKSFFIINSGKMFNAMAVPFVVIFVLLFPVVFAVISLAKFIINHVFGLEYSKEKPVFGLTDVNQYLKTMHRVRASDRHLTITTPTPMQPAANRRLKDTEQPLLLKFGNPESNSVRPYTLSLQVAVDTAFSGVVFSQVGIKPGDNGVTQLLLPNKLQAGRVYFWRIRAEDGANESDWSAPSAFEVLQPIVIGVPNPLAPVGNVRVTTANPQLRVGNGVSTGPYGALQYNFQVSQSPAFTGLIANDWVPQGGGETAFTVPASPGPDIQLYWRVRIADNEGNFGDWSRAETYRTPLASAPPGGGGGGTGGGGNGASCAGSDGPTIVACIERKYPDRLAAGVSEHQRRENMEFLRDRIIEAGLCGGMDLGRNLKRGGPEISVDFLVWRRAGGDVGIDIGAAYDDTSQTLRLQWSESTFPFYQAYPKPSCG
jgi:hypothetical protein